MGIQKDAGEILIYIYNKLVSGAEMPQEIELKEITKWDDNRVKMSTQYLINKNLVRGKEHYGLGSIRVRFISLNDITPSGVDIIENTEKFAKEFNFTVGIPGVFSYSWGAKQK
jgi:hypothetical protein